MLAFVLWFVICQTQPLAWSPWSSTRFVGAVLCGVLYHDFVCSIPLTFWVSRGGSEANCESGMFFLCYTVALLGEVA